MFGRALWANAQNGVFVNGTATVPIADGRYRIHLCLHRTGAPRQRILRNVSPAEVLGGPAVPPITIRVSADEVRAAIEELQQPPAGK